MSRNCPTSPKLLCLAISSLIRSNGHTRKHALSLPVLLAIGLLSFFGADLAQTVCVFTAPVTWTNGANDSGTNVCISDSTSNVTLNTNVSVSSLQPASGNTLTQNPNTQLSMFGPQIINDIQIVMNAGGGTDTYLFVNSVTTLSGTGLAINNSGTINANSTGSPLIATLTFNNLGGINNTGLLEATNGSVLQPPSQTINNSV